MRKLLINNFLPRHDFVDIINLCDEFKYEFDTKDNGNLLLNINNLLPRQ